MGLKVAEVRLLGGPAGAWLRFVAPIAGLVVVMLSLLALLGWALDLGALRSVAPGLPEIKANTAIGLLCAGLALVFLSEDVGRGRMGRGLGLLVAGFGLLLLFEYVVASVGVDELLFHDPAVRYPGRPSVHTAVAFVALGLALASVDARRVPEWVHQTLVVLLTVIVEFALVGYMYGVGYLNRLSSGTGLAVQTLVALMLLTSGMVAIHPERALVGLLRGKDAGARLARVMLPIGITSPLAVGGLCFAARELGVVGPRVALAAFTLAMVFLVSTVVIVLAVHLRGADADARQAQEQFRGAFDHAPIGMVLLDLDLRIVKVNGSFCEIVGYSSEQLIGLGVESITHPDDVARERDGMYSVLAGERTEYSIEKRYLHASGHPVQAAVHTTTLRAVDGTPLSVLVQVQDISDRKRHEEQLEYLADHDALTGLLNRRAFRRELENHTALAARYGPEGSVLIIDLDHFKFVNDTLGHHAGNAAIVHAARVLATRLRSSDVLARLGGDEFGVLLPRAGPSAALRVAEQLLQALRDEEIAIGGLRRNLTGSIGMASFEDPTQPTGEEVLVNADLAMYDAKEAGRDQAASFRTDEHAEPRMKARMTWINRIQHALATGGFALLAQPIVELATNTVASYELLLRMQDEQGDLIPPGAFLYIAERLDFISQIDQWVVTNGLAQFADLDQLAANRAVAINLSAPSLGNSKLLQLIQSELKNTGIDPQRLVFEITETAALASVTNARAFADELSRIGCRFAIDDFGAGFGSFYYLKHLAFDLIKIDGEFVRNATASDTDQLLIGAIVEIARGLGKQTIAEFVGNHETVTLLKRLGIDHGQGFHLGKPAPLADHLQSASGIATAHPDAQADRTSAAADRCSAPPPAPNDHLPT